MNEKGAKSADKQHKPIGLAAFDSLRAENEAWLEHCLVLPLAFDLIAGTSSYLVYGPDGSGKTALFNALVDHLRYSPGQQGPPHHLVVRWRPCRLEGNVEGSDAALAQLEHSLGQSAEALLAYLARWPGGFAGAPLDIKGTLTWFIHRYLGREAETQIKAQAALAQGPGRKILLSLLSGPRASEFLSGAEPDEIIDELIKALGEVGPKIVYILVGPDDSGDPYQLEQDLHAFLSAPGLFENACFAYKMVLPAKIGKPLSESGAVDRHRVRVHILSWHRDELEDMVVQRATIASGQPLGSLAEICEDEQLAEWLERTGGDNPRGWLQYITPLMIHYLRQKQVISRQEWRTIRQASPPPLTMDPESGVVTVGRRIVDDLAEGSLCLLEHLYQHRGQVCSRQDLYKAYQKLSHLDESVENVQEEPKEYAHTLDSAMSRLRQEIEPDPKTKTYIITVRGRGYKLEHVWEGSDREVAVR